MNSAGVVVEKCSDIIIVYNTYTLYIFVLYCYLNLFALRTQKYISSRTKYFFFNKKKKSF
jgi:hypothetical protein